MISRAMANASPRDTRAEWGIFYQVVGGITLVALKERLMKAGYDQYQDATFGG
jgi:hypothetical protein